jgi:hypothetical protein
VSFWSDSYGLRPSVVIGAIALVLVALLFFAIRAGDCSRSRLLHHDTDADELRQWLHYRHANPDVG